MKHAWLLCDYFGTGGGAGTVACVMAEELAKVAQVTVLTARAQENLSPPNYEIKKFDLEYPAGLRNFLGIYHPRAIRILRKYLKQSRPEVVFIHNLHTYWSYHALKLFARYKVGTILTFHDVSAFTPYVKLCRIRAGHYHYSWLRHARDAKMTFNPLRNFLIRKYLRYAGKTVAVSNELAKALKQNGIRVDCVIQNGIAVSGSIHDWSPPEQIIFFGGRLSTSKGALQAVRYLESLKTKHNLLPKLYVAGGLGVVTEKMKQLAEALGVSGQIEFLGWLDRKAYERRLTQSSVVIVPSICFDAFPTVILEAMKFAKPVVATNLGGSKELVEEGATGFIVDPFEVEKFADRIAELLLYSSKIKEMGMAGYERVKKRFSALRMVQDYLAELTDLFHSG